MLFAQHAQQLTASVASIQNRIDELEELLKGLRNDKANLEAELQQILTLEGAAESAINQSQMFINAANSLGRNDLIDTFWTALDSLRNSAIAKLPEAPETNTTPESEPVNPIEPDNNPVQTDTLPDTTPDTITVEATEATEQEPDTLPDTSPVEPDTIPQNGKQPLSVGSAAFNPSDASMDDLKRYVRGYQDDDTTRQFGTLTRRSTWETAAKKLLNS